MNKYLNQWKIIEESLKEERIVQLPDCLEKEHLFQIRNMLEVEGFKSRIRISCTWHLLL